MIYNECVNIFGIYEICQEKFKYTKSIRIFVNSKGLFLKVVILFSKFSLYIKASNRKALCVKLFT